MCGNWFGEWHIGAPVFKTVPLMEAGDSGDLSTIIAETVVSGAGSENWMTWLDSQTRNFSVKAFYSLLLLGVSLLSAISIYVV